MATWRISRYTIKNVCYTFPILIITKGKASFSVVEFCKKYPQMRNMDENQGKIQQQQNEWMRSAICTFLSAREIRDADKYMIKC